MSPQYPQQGPGPYGPPQNGWNQNGWNQGSTYQAGWDQSGWNQPAYAPEKKSPMLGIFSLGLLLLAMVAGTIWTYFSYPEVEAWNAAGQPEGGLTGELLAYTLGCTVLWLIGVLTFILGIVATASGRGRLWGILAIVLSVLAPFLTLGIGAAMSGSL